MREESNLLSDRDFDIFHAYFWVIPHYRRMLFFKLESRQTRSAGERLSRRHRQNRYKICLLKSWRHKQIVVQFKFKPRDNRFSSLSKNTKQVKMLKVLFVCSIVGVVFAQRGHYAGNSRPILGSRYQTDNGNAAQAPAQNNLTPAQNNFAPAQQNTGNRVDQGNQYGGNNDYYDEPAFGFGPPHYPFQGFHQQGFGSNGFNGRWVIKTSVRW